MLAFSKPKKAIATLDNMAIAIVSVKAVVNRGEKVSNAYMMVSIRFELLVGVLVGSARLFSLCSSVVNRNEWGIASSRYGCTIGTKKKGVKFFFKFFFVGCGCLGVGAWVWVWGAWVGRWGGRDGDGRARDEAGWIGIVALGWT